jgi:tetratricopeptide (TPR) repeat protein
MKPGDVLADRFEVERIAGQGGMGVVWRARDRRTGEPVALKVTVPVELPRFEREVSLLAELRHPAIVRYVAHGESDGHPWVAMEWLEGEDLDVRLSRGPLSLSESLALARRIAEGLAIVHARGLVHRDVKPSNVFLPEGRAEEAKLLDFGVARTLRTQLTRTGVAVGTPGYMAPEQARGRSDVDARADVFSLGCVLFECIAGVPAFAGEHLIAVLAKVLLEDARPLRELASVPREVDELVARMLAKDPDKRPPDGAAVAAALGALVARAADDRRSASVAPCLSAPPASALSGQELALTSVVLLGDRWENADRTLAEAAARDEIDRLREIGERFGATVERLVDGSILALSTTRGPAKDRAVQAARCALALRRALPGRPCALATGRAAVGGALPVGEAIDRASRLLRMTQTDDGVRVDPVAASLLEADFEIEGGVLRGERTEHGADVVGRAVPCVGRERELALLEGVFHECVATPGARVALITGPAGSGKSRLVRELRARLQARGEPVAWWYGRADAMRAGAPLGVVCDALRHVFALRADDPPEVRREAIRVRAQSVPDEPERVAWFLGEMLGVPFDDAESPKLRAARRDAQLMGDQVRRAIEDFVAAEAARAPVVLALEDLQWTDVPTLKLVDGLLRDLAHAPLFVVATGRPELEELFPKLWEERPRYVLPLRALGRKAALELLRHLVPDVDPERARDLVDRAEGNPLFIEELVRAEAAGRAGELPPSLLAMITSRLEQLEAPMRRVLRAASVFGRTSFRGGLLSLTQMPPSELDAAVEHLVAHELVDASMTARFPGERELVFRHEVVREAAYAMLTDADRALGHRLAAEFLQTAGERDAFVLAEHFEKGGDRARAAVCYLHAARQALGASDLEAATARAERGIACGATAELRGELRSIQAECELSRGTVARARELGELALRDLAPGSAPWREAVAELVATEVRAGDVGRASEVGRRLLAWPVDSALAASAQLRAATNLTQAGQHDLAAEIAEHVGAFDDPCVRMWREAYVGYRCLIQGDLEGALRAFLASGRACEEAGDLRLRLNAQTNAGYALSELGDYDAAARELEGAMEAGKRLGFVRGVEMARQNLGVARGRQGALSEGIALTRAAAESFARLGDRCMEAMSRVYAARLIADSGDLASAETEVRDALGKLAAVPSLYALAQAALSRVLLAQGRIEEARAAAEGAFHFLERGGKVEEGEGLVWLAWAEALEATGHHDEARAVVRRQADAIRVRASRIKDAALRASFLGRIPENARMLELARAFDRAPA